MPSRIVPRVLAPPLINFGSVPFSGVIVLVLVCGYAEWIAIQSTCVIDAMLLSIKSVNPVMD
jgi:hypothetical protein